MTKGGGLGSTSLGVLQLLAEGHTVPDMAKRLCLCDNSIKYHLRQLARYFGITCSRGQSHLRKIVWAGIAAALVQLPSSP